jgi:hypothetical protein
MLRYSGCSAYTDDPSGAPDTGFGVHASSAAACVGFPEWTGMLLIGLLVRPRRFRIQMTTTPLKTAKGITTPIAAAAAAGNPEAAAAGGTGSGT